MADASDLDDRQYQDLVDSARQHMARLAYRHGAESDEMLQAVVEATALMIDQLSHRLNAFPDRMNAAVLDILGTPRFPGRSARCEVTFWLSSALTDSEIVVPRATQLQAPISPGKPVFSTVADLRLRPAGPFRFVIESDDRQVLSDVAGARFTDPPPANSAFCLGFADPLPSHTLILEIDCRTEGVGVDPANPPLIWEASVGDGWAPCTVHSDETGGLQRPGQVILLVPEAHSNRSVAAESGAWLRCRIIERASGQPTYRTSPELHALTAHTVGGTAAVIHGEVVTEELLGIATGQPGQTFALRRGPVVAPDDRVAVEELRNDEWVPWQPVASFAESAPTDRHVVIDADRGEVRFGPRIRRPDGEYRHFGATPLADAPIRIRNYQVGGGRSGNVMTGSITVLLQHVPFVSRVENPAPATGGVDAETEAEAVARIPLELRSRGRAVTSADFEYIARQAAPELARVQCRPEPDGRGVRVVVVPSVAQHPPGTVQLADFLPSEQTLARIAEQLDRRRVAGVRLMVQPAQYHGVSVVAEVRQKGSPPDVVRSRAVAALDEYFHPTRGGPDRTGWPFGRSVRIWDAYAVLQQVPGVDAVEHVELFAADPVSGARSESVQQIELGPDALALSVLHGIRVIT